MKVTKKIFPLLLLSIAVSCCEKGVLDANQDGSGEGGLPEGNIEILIKADRTSYYPNPLSGWVIYVPLIDDVEEFWEKYENFPSSEGTVNVFDYGNVIYLRGSWTDFNPEEGLYIWQDGIDEVMYPLARSLRLFEEGAKERGLKLAFTLKTDSRDANANCTPQFVRDKMDAAYGLDACGKLSTDNVHTPGKGYFTFTLGTNPPRPYWSPYSDDPVFQQEYEKFINALAAEYDDPEITEFVSGLGMGKWGEYHTCIYSTGDETPKIPVFNWVTDTYIKAFKQTPCFTNYHKMVGTIVGEGNGDPDSEGMLNSAIEKGFCMRHDAFGMRAESFGYASWEKKFIANWTYKVPVAGEGGWIVNQGYEDVGILFPSIQQVQEASEYYREKDYLVESKINDNITLNFDTPTPKIMPYKSAKGLQFEAVFLPECNLSNYERMNELYVAITRTYQSLYIMYSGGELSPLLESVPAELYDTLN